MPNQHPSQPFREWQIVGLILITIIALGFGQAVKKRPNNFPPPIATVPPAEQSEVKKLDLRLNGAIFSVELAQTAAEQIRGLSGRPTLGQAEGLLFVYATSTTPRFWMKEMNFPLDLIWLDQDKKVVEITPDLSPNTYPQTFSPQTPVRYVLEVAAGTAAKNNLKPGDLIHFSLAETL